MGFETTDQRDFYDLAIGNVPFGQYQVNDRAYNKLGVNIHNYFIAKSLDQVRPSGVARHLSWASATVRQRIGRRCSGPLRSIRPPGCW